MNTQMGNTTKIIEAYRRTPVKGKRYNAIMASHVVWDHTLKDHRYFAEVTDWRYMGTLIEGFRTGSGDGSHYWEHYNCDGNILRLDYDYEGTLCFEEISDTVLPSPPPTSPSRIDKYISPKPQQGQKLTPEQYGFPTH